jgi:hypothetical protein
MLLLPCFLMPWMYCTARATNRNRKIEIVRPRFSRDTRYVTPVSSAVAKFFMTDEAS